jgi:subtilisin family serine protease
VAGVNWTGQVMALKFLSASGSGSTSAAAQAVRYAADKGAQVSNNSYGSGGSSTTLSNAIAYANTKGHVFVAAAGNSGANADTSRFYPAGYNHSNILSVAATTSGGNLASFSNYGVQTVDLGAPGSGIYSTLPNNRYASWSGTSMAAPHVAGVAALVFAANPTMTAADVITRILQTTTPLASLAGRTVTGGLVNAAAAVGTPAPAVVPPRVQTVQVNDGGAQRSRVTELTVTFTAQVTLPANPAAAFTLTWVGGKAVPFTATAATAGGVTVVTLTNFAVAEFGSLSDGRYALTVLASQVGVGGLPLDGNGDGAGGDDYTFGDAQGLYRYFGDVTGDRAVNGLDFDAFRTAFGTTAGDPAYLAALDFNADGAINGLDFDQFRARFGGTLA